MKHWFLSIAALTFLAATLLSLETAQAQDKPKPIRALLVIGGCCHDYATKGHSHQGNLRAGPCRMGDFLRSGQGDQASQSRSTKSPDWAKNFDVVVHDECCADVTDEAVINRILEPHRAGLPAVVLHCGMHSYRSKGYPKTTPWFEFTGLPSTAMVRSSQLRCRSLTKIAPITKGLADWTTINEELYNNSAGKLLDTARPLARGKQGKKRFRGRLDQHLHGQDEGIRHHAGA